MAAPEPGEALKAVIIERRLGTAPVHLGRLR
jgi:hypothetical protein